MTKLAKRPQTEGQMNIRITAEDVKLMRDLGRKLGMNNSAVLKLGLRRLAEAEKR